MKIRSGFVSNSSSSSFVIYSPRKGILGKIDNLKKHAEMIFYRLKYKFIKPKDYDEECIEHDDRIVEYDDIIGTEDSKD